MALMAIDHASYFVAKNHPSEVWGLPMPQYTQGWTFLTRFITHICPTGFFFLMGISMALFAASRQRIGWSAQRIRRHFLVRGVIIILAQQVFENVAWLIGTPATATNLVNMPGSGGTVWLNFGVLTGLGLTMIFWALLFQTRDSILISISLGAVLLTQFVTPGPANVATRYFPLVRLLLIPGQTGMWQVYYPVIPWMGLAGVGLVFGRAILSNRQNAKRKALLAGMVSLALFIPIRLLGGWGNFHPVNAGWIGFLNVTKYPPSLSYLLLTLGGVFLLLALFLHIEGKLGTWSAPLLTFGRTPLFFYLLHLYLFMLVGKLFPSRAPLGLMYAIWLVGLALLYPVCRAYGRFKHRTPPGAIWRYF